MCPQEDLDSARSGNYGLEDGLVEDGVLAVQEDPIEAEVNFMCACLNDQQGGMLSYPDNLN